MARRRIDLTDPVVIDALVLTVGAMVLFCLGYQAAALISMVCGVIGLVATRLRYQRRKQSIYEHDRFP